MVATEREEEQVIVWEPWRLSEKKERTEALKETKWRFTGHVTL